MKNTISFPFFYLFLLGFLSFNLHGLFAQTSVDSIDYYYNLALNPKQNTDMASAYNFFVKHKEMCLNNNYIEGAIHDLSLLSIIQNESGFYYDSEASAVEAISLLEKLNVSDYTISSKIGLYNQLGKVSRALKENESALMYYNKAFELAKKPEQLNKIINNRAFIYLDENKLDKALQEFTKAYGISLKINDQREIARNLDNMGYVKAKLNHSDALSELERALSMRLGLNDIEGTYASYTHLFEYYNIRNDEQNALSNLNKSLAVANTLNSDSYKLDALSEYVNLNNDSLVLAYKTLNDKMALDNLLTENKYASRKYDYTKKELEAQRHKLQKERYQMLGGLLLLLAMFSYFLLSTKHKKDKIQQVFKTETRISKKIHDELANDMSDLMNYVENDLETSQENKTKLLTTLQDVYVRTRDISTETASVDFANFSDSLKYLLIQHNKQNVKVIINDINTIEWKTISDHKKLAVYRCLQELMVNMKKHSQAQLVTVVFKTHKNKNEIWYTDDGQGCSLDEIKLSGLSNAEFRIKEIGGKLTFETSQGNGFKAVITFYN